MAEKEKKVEKAESKVSKEKYAVVWLAQAISKISNDLRGIDKRVAAIASIYNQYKVVDHFEAKGEMYFIVEV